MTLKTQHSLDCPVEYGGECTCYQSIIPNLLEESGGVREVLELMASFSVTDDNRLLVQAAQMMLDGNFKEAKELLTSHV